MKKTLLLFVLTLLSTLTASAYDAEVDSIYYNLYSDTKQAEVTSGNGYTGTVTIPETVTYNDVTYSVTSIGDFAFRNCSGLTEVTIPNSVTSIGYYAFSNCSGLTEVTIPNSVTTIGNHAFSGCSGLTSVTIPNSVTSIGIYAFYGCSGLTSVTIPNSITSIGSRTFYNCSSLTSVTIPNSVKTIGYYAFYNCSSLTEVTIPNSVTSIGGWAFYGCSGLTSVTIPNSVIYVGNAAFEGTAWYNNQTDGVVYVGKVAYKYKGTMPENTSVTIKEGTTAIGSTAFENCKGLQSINIPNSVTSIGESAFYNCSSLTSVTIPNSVTSIGDWAFSDCSGLTSVTIPNSVISIGMEAFYNCSGLSSVTIPNSVTLIRNWAFSNCSGLTSISVESGNTKYDSRENCNAIIETETNTLIAGCQNTVIPNSVTSIGDYAFWGCSDLVSVTIPNSVTEIGRSAFYGTAWYNNQPDGVVYVGKIAYKYKGTMPENTSITLKEGTTAIGNYAFSDCSSLTSVTIPNSLTSIGSFAFERCSGLTSVTIPNSVTSIGSFAFSNCSSLTGVTIPNNVTSISRSAFELCSSLTEVTIPNGVTSIGESAFWGCSGLTSVTIGESVTSIGGGAFQSGHNLASVYCYAKDVPSTNIYTFSNISVADATLYVPAASIEAYKTTAPWSDFGSIVALDEPSISGDVNGDGIINGTDIQTIINLIVAGEYDAKADVNEDGEVNGTDIQEVINYIVNGPDEVYFYLGTTQPTANNYTSLPGVVTSYTSIDDAIGTAAYVFAGETLYMLCPAAWMEGKTVELEDNSGNKFSFLEEKDVSTISGYVIYKTQVWNAPNEVALKTDGTMPTPSTEEVTTAGIFKASTDDDRTNTSLTVKWPSDVAVTMIRTMKMNGEAEELVAEDIIEDATKGEFTKTGLDPDTEYIFYIYNGEDCQGRSVNTTFPNYTEYTAQDDFDLQAAIDGLAEGYALMLSPAKDGTNEFNLVSSTVNITKNVRIMARNTKPVVVNKAAFNLDGATGLSLENITFADAEKRLALLKFTNASGDYKVSNVELTGYKNFAHDPGGDACEVNQLLVVNCFMHDGISGRWMDFQKRKCYVKDITIIQNTFANIANNMDFLRYDYYEAHMPTILLENNSFYKVNATSKGMMYVRSNAQGDMAFKCDINKNIFEDCKDTYFSEDRRTDALTFSKNYYKNSDCLTIPYYAGFTAYDYSANSYTGTMAFKNPDNNDFTIRNTTLIEAGVGNTEFVKK